MEKTRKKRNYYTPELKSIMAKKINALMDSGYTDSMIGDMLDVSRNLIHSWRHDGLINSRANSDYFRKIAELSNAKQKAQKEARMAQMAIEVDDPGSTSFNGEVLATLKEICEYLKQIRDALL